MIRLRPNRDCLPLSRPALGERSAHRSVLGRLNISLVLAGTLLQLLLFGVDTRPASANESCPAVLDRLESHQTEPGETFTSVAAGYDLRPETLARFNVSLGIGSFTQTLPTGTTLTVPPFNGRVVEAVAGDSWQSLAERYGSRPDVLFEVNGCVSEIPGSVFIPGANLAGNLASPSQFQLRGYPLSQPASIALSYGWQPHSTRDELVFNSGIAFTVDEPMEVRSVGPGTVAFVGDREGYGQLLVVNHPEGLQTRYANLSDISVSTGQAVSETTVVGSVGQPTGASEENGPTYLYFEVRTNSSEGWVAQDPGKYLPALELR
ncbi:MAG: M23 family metallopeptidase [Cyanobacteria bacterium J06648_10]